MENKNIRPKDKGYLQGNEITIAMNKAYSMLEAIDLKPYLEQFKGKPVYELMDKLDDDFPYEDEYTDSILGVVSECEFVDYINKRYNLKIREVTTTSYYL